VGDHPAFVQALDSAGLIAQHTAPVLVTGETGTGKDLIAQFVHRMSDRHAGAFVAVNCAAIPADLVESILLGHRKGAFTGATADQVGKFVQADGGTLFLDELAELPLAAQAKLLRVLQDGVVEPIGALDPIYTDVRIVAATNRDLVEAVRAGDFREDLYYRLDVGKVRLPALRERSSDVPKIALHVLDRVNKSLRTPKNLTPEALVWLQRQPWPGNIRDLANTIERSAMMTREQTLGVAELIPSDPAGSDSWLEALPAPREGFSLEAVLSDVRGRLFHQALAMCGGNQTQAAQLLGVTHQAVSKHVRTTSTAPDSSATT
jgi:two-component system response regulator AtoC